MRIFYVDAALSITSKTGKRYWKCSVVENGKNVVNFINGKSWHSAEAEAYSILALIFWLIEQKEKGEIKIFTDCLALIKSDFYKKLAEKVGKKRKDKILKQGKIAKRTKAFHFLKIAREISERNSLKLELFWIRGKENPADFYSRLNNGKYHTRPDRG